MNRRDALRGVLASLMGIMLPWARPSETVARSGQIKKVALDVGFIITDGDGNPLRPPSGIKLFIFKIGGSRQAWPKDLWVQLSGHPDDQGYVWSKGAFPVDSDFIKQLTN